MWMELGLLFYDLITRYPSSFFQAKANHEEHIAGNSLKLFEQEH